jgi:hypothetical protein
MLREHDSKPYRLGSAVSQVKGHNVLRWNHVVVASKRDRALIRLVSCPVSAGLLPGRTGSSVNSSRYAESPAPLRRSPAWTVGARLSAPVRLQDVTSVRASQGKRRHLGDPPSRRWILSSAPAFMPGLARLVS